MAAAVPGYALHRCRHASTLILIDALLSSCLTRGKRTAPSCVGWSAMAGLSGTDARNALAQLYASSRLYINFFQPSFKLKSKTRDGARVHKVYFAPATPCDRLLAHDSVEPAIKEKLKAQFKGLDPVRLLQEMRTAQQTLSDSRCPRRAY